MDQAFIILAMTAVTIGTVHTFIGVDHYLPFIVLGKARAWTIKKSILVTLICGVGHVLSSVAIGMIGLFFGSALEKLELIESNRGDIASYLLVAFGLLYTIYGIKKSLSTEHHHKHSHKNFGLYWSLFIIFIFGPCEALIPLLMYPAATHSYTSMLFITLLFSLATISTMLVMVTSGTYGLSFIKIKRIERYSDLFAGSAIFISGLAIVFLGV